MGTTAAAGTRCPRCSAAVRAGAPWCTQCYAPADAPATATTTAATAAVEAVTAPPAGVRVADRAPSTAPSAATWPCSTCGCPNALALAACDGCGTPFLADVRARPTVVLPGVGDLLALPPGRRVGLAVCVVAAVLVIGAVLALLLA